MEAATATTSGAPDAQQTVTPSTNEVPITVSDGTPPAQATEWFNGFNDELKGYVQTKGFKDPQTVVESYRGLEKLMGAPKDRILKLPEKADAPEWNDIYAKLGRPQDGTGYKFELPKDTNPAFESWARENFHKLGLTKAQGEALMKGYMELNSNHQNELTSQKQSAFQNQEAALKKDWGAAYDQNVQAARIAANQFGFSAEAIDTLQDAMGYDGVMKFLSNLGSKVGEAQFVGNNTGNGFGVLTPQQAMNEIRELKNDKEFISRYANGDREAVQRINQLTKWASPE